MSNATAASLSNNSSIRNEAQGSTGSPLANGAPMGEAVMMFNPRGIPSDLKGVPQWVCWKMKQEGDRMGKIPVCATTEALASSTNPDTWTDYYTAEAKAMRMKDLGLGFVFTQQTGIIGIDLDKCRDATTGTLDSWAQDIVDRMQTYTEVSPSGCGVHLYARGALPGGKRRRGQIEAYQTGRFFTVTGDHLPNTPLRVEGRSQQLAEFHAEYLADPESTPTPRLTPEHPRVEPSDEEILSKCRSAKNSRKFDRLWRGNFSEYDSHSEGDMALLGVLAFYTQDPSQLDRLFRRSGLMRSKWDDLHGELTYGARSIVEALSHVTETYSPSKTLSVSGLSGPSSGEWPEIQPVKTELLPVEPLPLDIIPAPFRRWIADVSNRMQCPPDFVAAAMLSMTGAIVGAACGIRPKQYDDWTVVPNLWGGVVARPSMLKTPAIGEAMKPMDRLECAAKLAYDAAKKNHEADCEAYKAKREALQTNMRKAARAQAESELGVLKSDYTNLEEPKPPVWRRYKTHDATIEKMAELQRDNPRGLLLFRDELIGVFATWDKDGHETDRAFYLESWNGNRPYTSDRIGRGTVFIENLCVSLFGGIQPTKLTGYLHQAMRGCNNDGLVQRLQILVYPDEPKVWRLIDTPVNARAKEQAYQVIERLASMDFRQYEAFGEEDQRIPYFRFDEEAQLIFNEWLTELETRLRQLDDEPVLIEHLGKYRSLMPALALIFHVLDLADGRVPSQVTVENAKRAAAWCEYLESHARRVYGLVTNLTDQAASRLALKIQQGALPNPFTVRDVYRKEWSLLDD